MKQVILLCLIALLYIPNTTFAQWQLVGTRGFSDGAVGGMVTKVDKNDVPYVVYRDFAHSEKITVMKYNNVQWVNEGPVGFTSGKGIHSDIAFNNANVPYVVYCAEDFSYKVVVRMFDGNNWVAVGNSQGISTVQARYTKIAIYNDTPFVAFSDNSVNEKLTVMKYDGTNWATVGTAGVSPNEATEIDFAVNSNGELYVSFINGKTNSDHISVMKYDGTQWSTLGMHSFGGKYQTYMALNSNSVPHVSTPLRNGTVEYYNSNTNSWDTLGQNGFAGFQISQTSIAIDKRNNVYQAFVNTGSNPPAKLSVMRYTGSNWVYVGSDRFSIGDASNVKLAIDSKTTVYVGYRESSNNSKATVMKYECPYTIPNVQICAVTADTSLGNGGNVVYWNKGNVQYIDSYRVYRDSNGTYKHIGSIAANATSQFLDIATNQNAGNNNYKLTLLDSCNREMSLDSSNAHTTMHLIFNYLSSTNDATISWNAYKGLPISTYYITRNNGSGNFSLIDSVTTTNTSITYVDSNAPTGQNSYRVYAAIPNGGCDIGTGIQQTRTYSNTVTSWNTSISEVNENQSLKVHPNPADDNLTITSSTKIEKVILYDITGRLLQTYSYNNSKSVNLNISELSVGFYLLNVITINQEVKNARFQKH